MRSRGGVPVTSFFLLLKTCECLAGWAAQIGAYGILRDVRPVDYPHHLAVFEHRRFLEMALRKHTANLAETVLTTYANHAFGAYLPYADVEHAS